MINYADYDYEAAVWDTELNVNIKSAPGLSRARVL